MVSLSVAEWILFGTFLITVGGIIWKMAILHHKCESNEKSNIRIHERVDKIEDTMTNRIEEFRLELKEVSNMQIRLETKLNILIEREIRN